MRGEELHRLNVEQLQELEKSLESGLGSVLKTKSKKILDEIDGLERKRMQLIEENLRLKEQVSTLNFICPVETRQRLGDVNHFPLSKKKTFSLCLLCSFI
jgi:hypothetical protein